MSEEEAVLSDVGEVSEDRVVVGEEGSDSGVEIVGGSERDSAARKQADGETTLKDSGGYLHRSPGEIERERRNRRKKRKEEHSDEDVSTTLKKVDSPRWLAPTMNSAAQKRPMCKDGIACCSDDPQHFVNFKHTPHHNFQETSFASRTSCHFCGNNIWQPMKKQGYVCMNNGCGYCIHKKCLSRAFNETECAALAGHNDIPRSSQEKKREPKMRRERGRRKAKGESSSSDTDKEGHESEEKEREKKQEGESEEKQEEKKDVQKDEKREATEAEGGVSVNAETGERVREVKRLRARGATEKDNTLRHNSERPQLRHSQSDSKVVKRLQLGEKSKYRDSLERYAKAKGAAATNKDETFFFDVEAFLPDDLLIRIFQFLEPFPAGADILIASAVSRRWRRIASKEIFWPYGLPRKRFAALYLNWNQGIYQRREYKLHPGASLVNFDKDTALLVSPCAISKRQANVIEVHDLLCGGSIGFPEHLSYLDTDFVFKDQWWCLGEPCIDGYHVAFLTNGRRIGLQLCEFARVDKRVLVEAERSKGGKDNERIPRKSKIGNSKAGRGKDRRGAKRQDVEIKRVGGGVVVGGSARQGPVVVPAMRRWERTAPNAYKKAEILGSTRSPRVQAPSTADTTATTQQQPQQSDPASAEREGGEKEREGRDIDEEGEEGEEEEEGGEREGEGEEGVFPLEQEEGQRSTPKQPQGDTIDTTSAPNPQQRSQQSTPSLPLSPRGGGGDALNIVDIPTSSSNFEQQRKALEVLRAMPPLSPKKVHILESYDTKTMREIRRKKKKQTALRYKPKPINEDDQTTMTSATTSSLPAIHPNSNNNSSTHPPQQSQQHQHPQQPSTQESEVEGDASNLKLVLQKQLFIGMRVSPTCLALSYPYVAIGHSRGGSQGAFVSVFDFDTGKILYEIKHDLSIPTLPLFRKQKAFPSVYKLKLDYRIMVSIAWNKDFHSTFETIVTDLPTGRILFIIEDPPAQDVSWDHESGLFVAVGINRLAIFDLKNYGKLLSTVDGLFDPSGSTLKIDRNFISVCRFDEKYDLSRQACIYEYLPEEKRVVDRLAHEEGDDVSSEATLREDEEEEKVTLLEIIPGPGVIIEANAALPIATATTDITCKIPNDSTSPTTNTLDPPTTTPGLASSPSRSDSSNEPHEDISSQSLPTDSTAAPPSDDLSTSPSVSQDFPSPPPPPSPPPLLPPSQTREGGRLVERICVAMPGLETRLHNYFTLTLLTSLQVFLFACNNEIHVHSLADGKLIYKLHPGFAASASAGEHRGASASECGIKTFLADFESIVVPETGWNSSGNYLTRVIFAEDIRSREKKCLQM